LGTAAGGGFPQWNCNCRICRVARSTPALARPRTQSGVAVSADGKAWYLLNASPDLLSQIQNFPPLAPLEQGIRKSPIQGVLLTNADLDHALGLALLREGQPLVAYSTPRVRDALIEGLGLLPMLSKYCGFHWRESGFEPQELCDREDQPSGLSIQAFDVPGSAPKYWDTQTRSQPGDSVAYRIIDLRTRGSLIFAPDVSVVEPALRQFVEQADVLLFDGTFWTEDEMQITGTGNAGAADMGHVPISGGTGSLAFLERLSVPQRVYMHINNTNPILLEDSPEREILRARGILVGEDGMEFDI
jgi:pyrroloquinoline quinone biosynthesis protein B